MLQTLTCVWRTWYEGMSVCRWTGWGSDYLQRSAALSLAWIQWLNKVTAMDVLTFFAWSPKTPCSRVTDIEGSLSWRWLSGSGHLFCIYLHFGTCSPVPSRWGPPFNSPTLASSPACLSPPGLVLAAQLNLHMLVLWLAAETQDRDYSAQASSSIYVEETLL